MRKSTKNLYQYLQRPKTLKNNDNYNDAKLDETIDLNITPKQLDELLDLNITPKKLDKQLDLNIRSNMLDELLDLNITPKKLDETLSTANTTKKLNEPLSTAITTKKLDEPLSNTNNIKSVVVNLSYKEMPDRRQKRNRTLKYNERIRKPKLRLRKPTPKQQSLHPYFDKIENITLLEPTGNIKLKAKRKIDTRQHKRGDTLKFTKHTSTPYNCSLGELYLDEEEAYAGCLDYFKKLPQEEQDQITKEIEFIEKINVE